MNTHESPHQALHSLELFQSLGDLEKLTLFTSLPREVQKLMIGLATFVTGAIPSMARSVSELSDEQFDQAVKYLLDTPYLNRIEAQPPFSERLQLDDSMHEFINGTLACIWNEQKARAADTATSDTPDNA